MSITYSEYVFVALGIQDAKRMHHIIICGLPRSATFSHIMSLTARFEKKKSYWTQNVGFDFLYNFCLKIFFILRRNKRDTITNVHRSPCKVPVILVGL